MTSATSLILIAVGAILAFAVSYQMSGISVQTVGAILIIVGGIGLAVSLATLAGYAPWGAGRTATPPTNVGVSTNVAAPTSAAPPTNV